LTQIGGHLSVSEGGDHDAKESPYALGGVPEAVAWNRTDVAQA